MLSALWERLRFPDRTTAVLTGEDRTGIPAELLAARHLTELRLEEGLPVWRYEAGGAVVEKRLVMPYGQNTVHLTYRLLAGPPTVRLTLRPSMHVRAHNAPVSEPLAEPYTLTAVAGRFEVAPGGGLPVAPADAARAGRVHRRSQPHHRRADIASRAAAATSHAAICGAPDTSGPTSASARR